MHPIRDGRLHFGNRLEVVARSFYVAQVKIRGVDIPPLSELSEERPAFARINCGRWIANCLCCPNAEYVFLDQPQIFCCGCLNALAGYRWRRVLVPENLLEIERVLIVRPLDENRSWDPGDSLDKMRADNLLHGLPAEFDELRFAVYRQRWRM